MADGGDGPVQLTTEGHTYDQFGDTNSEYYMTIGSHSDVNMYIAGRWRYQSIGLTGVPQEPSTNLCLHASSGITYDLEKIRQAMPFVKITQFTSFYGVANTPTDSEVSSDFYVFVDGVPRMLKPDVSNEDGPNHVAIPLAETDRFLTLVCTEGEDNYGDWSLFVNPVLELELGD